MATTPPPTTVPPVAPSTTAPAVPTTTVPAEAPTLESLEQQLIVLSGQLTIHSSSSDQRFDDLSVQIDAAADQTSSDITSLKSRMDALFASQDATITEEFSQLKDLIEALDTDVILAELLDLKDNAATKDAIVALQSTVDVVQDGVTANASDLQEVKLGIEEVKEVAGGEGTAEPGVPSETEIPSIPRIDLPEKTRILGVLVGFLENGVSKNAL